MKVLPKKEMCLKLATMAFLALSERVQSNKCLLVAKVTVQCLYTENGFFESTKKLRVPVPTKCSSRSRQGNFFSGKDTNFLRSKIRF